MPKTHLGPIHLGVKMAYLKFEKSEYEIIHKITKKKLHFDYIFDKIPDSAFRHNQGLKMRPNS